MMFVALITYQKPVFRAETKMGGRLKKLESSVTGWGLLLRTMRLSRLCSTWTKITAF